MRSLAYVHHDGGAITGALGSVFDFIAHAIAWSVVRRFIYELPGGWLWLVGLVSVAFMVWRAARRHRRRDYRR